MVPSGFLLDKASVAASSCQLLCLVASFESRIVVRRSAAYFAAVRSQFEEALFFDDAAITPVFFFFRLILRPDLSSEEE